MARSLCTLATARYTPSLVVGVGAWLAPDAGARHLIAGARRLIARAWCMILTAWRKERSSPGPDTGDQVPKLGECSLHCA